MISTIQLNLFDCRPHSITLVSIVAFMACQGSLKEICQLPILGGIKVDAVAGNFEGWVLSTNSLFGLASYDVPICQNPLTIEEAFD